MADHSKPLTTSTYANFVTELDGRFDDLSLGLDPANTTATNLATNSIRWSSASLKWQKYNGTTWADLAASYTININGTVGATTPAVGTFTTLSSTGNTTLGDAAADTVTINGTIQPGVIVSGSSTTDMFRITQTGTGNAFVVEDEANPDATPFKIDGSGNLSTSSNLTGPNHYGGTAVSSTLSLYSTSGVGTSDNISFLTGSQVQAMRIRTDQSISIGSQAGSAQCVVSVNKSMTGAATSRGIEYNGSIDASVVTNAAYPFQSAPDVGTGTLTNLQYFRASQGTFTGTVTNQYGFFVTSDLIGASTLNVGYGSNIASGTGRWNFYASGTANNLFNGYSFGLGSVIATTTSTATNTVTLTSTQVASGFIVGTPTATASYTLPLASALDTELTNAATGYNFELTVFTTAAFAITLLTNTGWTLLGSMATGATANSFARFRVRKTGAAAYSIYRVS